MTTAIFKEPQNIPGQTAIEDVDPDAPTPDAPFGWTTDPETGERRPKKTRGRQRRDAVPVETVPGVSPSLEELRAAGGPAQRREDVAPAPAPAKKGGGGAAAPAGPAVVPPFRAGPIAKGVNRIYRRAGKIVKIWDQQVGAAIIACTRKDEDEEEDDSLTVGEAWEEIARTNPQIRAFLLKALSGSAWSALFMAHAPIALALMMKDSIRRRLPFQRLTEAFLTDEDEDGTQYPSDISQMMGGLDPAAVAAMSAMVQGMMPGMFGDMPRNMNEGRSPAADGQAA